MIFISDMCQNFSRRPWYRTILYNIFLHPCQQMIWNPFNSTIIFTIISNIITLAFI